MSLRAGLASRDISPRGPTFLVGYPHVPRISTGIHDPLLVSALWLESDDAAVMLVSVDLLFVHHTTVRACREAISAATGIPATHILISSTHTHSGPVTVSMLPWSNDPVVPSPDPTYMELLRVQIVAAARDAARNREDAEMAVTAAAIRGVGGNRVKSDGATDPHANLLVLRSAAGHRPIGLDLVYSMHPTVLHEDSRLVSGDFPAFARREIQESLPGVTVVYHTGPCGDQSPRRHARAQTFEEAERLGRSLGSQVVRAIRTLEPRHYRNRARLDAAARSVLLPARKFPSIVDAQALLRTACERLDRLRREGAERADVRTAECAVFGAEELVALARADAVGATKRVWQTYRSAEVQALRLGDAFLVGLPGELFVEYGLAVKRAAPWPTGVISLANGELQGYVVTPDAEVAAGYEASCSLFPPEAGALLVSTAIELMGHLSL